MGRCLMGKLNKPDIIKWTALIIVIVLLFYISRTKTIEDYERAMDSQSMKDTK
jgi:hypothetical protein